MKERPIIFSAPMNRAILDGIKTQTRRVVKHRITGPDATEMFNWRDHKTGKWLASHGAGYPFSKTNAAQLCPYGQPGDILWVREAWRVGAWDEDSGRVAIDYRADGHCRREWLNPAGNDNGEQFYRLWQQSTDDARKTLGVRDRYEWEPGQSPCRWRPSIHMPRWASRIALEITNIRVERLNDISETDALAEGIETLTDQWQVSYGVPGKIADQPPCRAFQLLWESINGPDSWDANPWVWAIDFKRIRNRA